MKSNTVFRTIAGCSFLLYFLLFIVSLFVYGVVYDNVFLYFTSIKDWLYYFIYFIGMTILAVSLFTDLRYLSIVGCVLCIIRWIPALFSNIKYYIDIAKDPYTYGDIPFISRISGLVFCILFIITFTLLILACVLRKASLILGILSAVFVMGIIVFLIIVCLSSFNAGNFVEIISFLFLAAGCVTMGLAYSMEKRKKMPPQGPGYGPRGRGPQYDPRYHNPQPSYNGNHSRYPSGGPYSGNGY